MTRAYVCMKILEYPPPPPPGADRRDIMFAVHRVHAEYHTYGLDK